MQSNYSLHDVNPARPPAWNYTHGEGIAVSFTWMAVVFATICRENKTLVKSRTK
jgi:hypothetical protein